MPYEKFEVRVTFPWSFLANTAYNSISWSRGVWEPIINNYGFEVLDFYVEGNDLVFILGHRTDVAPAIVAAIILLILGVAAIFGWVTIRIKQLETQQKIAEVTAENLKQIVESPEVPYELRQQALSYLSKIPQTSGMENIFDKILWIFLIFFMFMILIKIIEAIR